MRTDSPLDIDLYEDVKQGFDEKTEPCMTLYEQTEV